MEGCDSSGECVFCMVCYNLLSTVYECTKDVFRDGTGSTNTSMLRQAVEATHQGENIAHAKDSASEPFRIEGLKSVHGLASPHELDRLAADSLD